MPNQVKSIKLLVGLCLNKNMSFQNISKLLGIPVSSYDINSIVEKYSEKGYLSDINISPKGTFANLTSSGIEYTSEVIQNKNVEVAY
ncbi:hypothetical protein [Flammeovirga kamogawensis]|uniref:Uncharacterized protein n=1 Tax=Flammeovirga kamogawensis TaxID=373891 RepID=A0ABX8GVT1_9BACT|nr:hypothetical protein [Flammeovirga kamogawensis]MBB6461061.1 hypothetical protein [Flammeovirga kamogawensis]QWG07631.1 hypothetical protein KM029_01435 [Flammeovirga kamogawensis]TRX69441.1 hypothetical protein EO216_15375 [Flammeovirga kamogawensis]